jgi:hypothetical protein
VGSWDGVWAPTHHATRLGIQSDLSRVFDAPCLDGVMFRESVHVGVSLFLSAYAVKDFRQRFRHGCLSTRKHKRQLIVSETRSRMNLKYVIPVTVTVKKEIMTPERWSIYVKTWEIVVSGLFMSRTLNNTHPADKHNLGIKPNAEYVSTLFSLPW